MKDRYGTSIKVGDCVIWHDPEVEARDLSIIWTINDIRGDSNDEDTIILITSEYGSEAEVYANELENINYVYSNSTSP